MARAMTAGSAMPATAGRQDWGGGMPRAHDPRRALWRAIVDAFVPGEAAADVVPALRAVELQPLLVRAGELDPRAVSGHWDRRTTDAVAAFQRHRGLPCTGIADRRTVDLLLAAHA
jgi:murein L,D-transpeptidase YcbB/YkuD